jgi:hypothetical protein
MNYTAEDFERIYPIYKASTPPDYEIVLAALQIAANAMRPGVIETAINGCYDPGTIGTAAAIRLALKRGTT